MHHTKIKIKIIWLSNDVSNIEKYTSMLLNINKLIFFPWIFGPSIAHLIILLN